jgi:hypothetical protein
MLEVAGIAMPGRRPAVVPGLQVDLHIPYTGTQELFIVAPTQRTLNPPQALVHNDRLVLTVTTGGGDDPTQFQTVIERWEAELAKWIGWVNSDLDNLERSVREKVTAQLNRRRSLLNKGDQLLAALNISIRHVDADQALELPIRPRRVAPIRLASSSPSQRRPGVGRRTLIPIR